MYFPGMVTKLEKIRADQPWAKPRELLARETV